MASKLYGLTHDVETGDVLIRTPKAIKISIGLPKGPDIHVKITPDGRWGVRIGDGKNKGSVSAFATMEEAQAFYNERRSKVPERIYPAKLKYFTFSRMSADGNYEPDWEAIRLHGPEPISIPIFFTETSPLDTQMELWSATELRCYGDGLDAHRLVTFPEGYETEASKAKAVGEKYYGIARGCVECGCPYAQPPSKEGKKGPCGPKGKLFLQLAYLPILGVTSYLYTTGKNSIKQLFSSIYTMKKIIGHGDPEAGSIVGIPLWLVAKEFRTKTPDGKMGKFVGLHVEFRKGAGGRSTIFDELMEAGLSNPGIPELSAGSSSTLTLEAVSTTEALRQLGSEEEQAQAHNAEFVAEVDGEELETDEGGDQGELHDDDIAVAQPAAPKPPLSQVRQDISKSGQAQKKRGSRIFELATKNGVSAKDLVVYLGNKIGRALEPGAAQLTPDEDAKIEKALVDLEAMDKAKLATEIAGKK